MSAYKRAEAKTSERRPFSITLGIVEGYGPEGKVHSVEEAVEASLDWMKSQAAAGRSYLTGTFTTGEVVYAWPEGPGEAGGGHEPTATFSGEVSVLYNADTSDEEVVRLLDELASYLGSALGQTRVYVSYRDETWVLQAEQTKTPTGETV